MKTNVFSTLNKVVHAAVGVQLGEEVDRDETTALGVATTRTRTIAGLDVTCNVARDSAYDDDEKRREWTLRKYIQDKNKIIDELEGENISPLAVVPVSLWDELCKHAGLYRFAPSSAGVVLVDALPLIEEAQAHALTCVGRRAVVKRMLILVIGFGLAAAIGIVWPSPDGLFVSVMTTLSTLLVLVLSWNECKSDWRTIERLRLDRLKDLISEHESAGTITEALWPEHIEPSRGVPIKIVLPVPPTDVQGILIAAESLKFQLKVAVVGGAISFCEPIADALVGKSGERWENAARSQQDPIVYIQNGSAVAILAQFGDFPLELDVMTKLVNSVI